MTDRSRYHLALTLTIVLVVVTMVACWFVAISAGVLGALAVGVALLPCVAFCCWRTWVSRARPSPEP